MSVPELQDFYPFWTRTHTYVNPSKDAYIYALHAPGSSEWRYIGRSQNPKKRLEKHVEYARRDPSKDPTLSWLMEQGYEPPVSEKSRWILDLLEQGLRPQQIVLETIHPCCALYTNVWIAALDHSTRHPMTDSHYLPYDLHISEREERWYLWAIRQGHPIADVSDQRRSIICAQDVDFLKEPYHSHVWQRLRAGITRVRQE